MGNIFPIFGSSESRIASSYDWDNFPLPAVAGLEIAGHASPGEEITACGFSINGTVACQFAWVRCSEEGSKRYIPGASQPSYMVTEEDVGYSLAVEVAPLDKRGRVGEVVEAFANQRKKITQL